MTRSSIARFALVSTLALGAVLPLGLATSASAQEAKGGHASAPLVQRRDVRDHREDRRDRREDVRDHREDVRDARHHGGVRDHREDRRDRREDGRDRREDRRDFLGQRR